MRPPGAKGTLPKDGVSLLRAAKDPDSLDGRGVLIETGPNPRGLPTYQSIRTERYRLELERTRALQRAATLDTASDARFQALLPFEPVNRPRLARLKAERQAAKSDAP